MILKTAPSISELVGIGPATKPQMFPGTRILLSRIFGLGIAGFMLFGHSSWAKPGRLLPELLFLLGLVLATTAMAGRMWCSFYIAGRKNAVLVTQGPYALCRNPLYLFSLIGGIGVGLASGMFLVVAVIVVAFAAYYPVTIRREENYLRQRHKDQFAAYCLAVPAFWPSFRQNLDVFPEGVTSSSRVFFNHLTSAIWFPVSCGLVHLLSCAHGIGILPVWFTLP